MFNLSSLRGVAGSILQGLIDHHNTHSGNIGTGNSGDKVRMATSIFLACLQNAPRLGRGGGSPLVQCCMYLAPVVWKSVCAYAVATSTGSTGLVHASQRAA